MATCIKCKAELPPGAKYCPMCGKKQVSEPRKALKRANGTGTVYKLQGRRRRPWVAAKNKVVIGYYETKTAATDALNRLAGRSLTERYNMTFSEVYDAWSAEHFKTVGDKSVLGYSVAFHAFAALHGKVFRQLRTADFQNVIDNHPARSKSSLSKLKILAMQMSQWAMREEIITTSFASFIQLPAAEKKEKEIFSEDDIAKLEADGGEAAKIVLMLIYTGMRINELFRLPVADYHESYVIGGEKTEAGKNRVIPIPQPARAYFAYFAQQATGPLLLSGFVGKHDSNKFRSCDYYPLLDRLKISRKTPHSTRHTYASRARAAGMPPEILQKILGHADYQTTANIYVHADIDELLHAAEIF